jgi:hypothetical protein
MATGAEMWRYRDVVDDPAGNRETFPLPFAPRGVFGLSDTDVYAWGTKKRGTDDYVHQVAHFDGTDWKLMPDVPFWFHGMHGCDPSCLYGVAPQGILHWDGGQWTPIPSPTNEGLNSVFVESEKEVYIAGEGGSLIEGSAVGFSVVAQLPAPIYAAAKFKGELYVGAGPLGLFRRKGKTGELELLKENIKATSLSARPEFLVASCPNVVGFTSDAVSWAGVGGDLSNITSHVDPRDP